MSAPTLDAIIIGGGLSGLTAAHFLRKQQPDINLTILEQSGRPGGAVQSFCEQGFRAEWGPHGFLNNTPASLELLRDHDLLDLAQQAPLGDFVRFLCHRGRLTQLPQNPKALLSTPLLSPLAKVRLLGDLFIPYNPANQSIGQWAGRRFGKGVLHLIDAAVTGTFAGDYTKLAIDAVMPGLRDLERATGSVLKGLKRKKRLTGSSPTALPAMLSFPQGMEQLTTTLAADKPIQFNQQVTAVDHRHDQWLVHTATSTFSAAKLVVALPINSSLSLLQALAPPPVDAVPVARINNVVMGFGPEAKVPYGFGYLAPEVENRFTMGVMFSSHMFPGRSPEGTVLLEALVGGRRHPERLELDDRELIDRVYDDISQLLELPKRPFFTRVLRPQSGIPQLEMDHLRLQDWRRQLQHRLPGLAICGFGWEGVGMNEMIKAARQAAEEILQESKTATAKEVKGVYF